MPTDVTLPPIWLLGSSGYSAELAAHVGAGFSFAHHFSDFPPEGPMLSYRREFKPSAWRQAPYAILGVAAICAETEGEADHLAGKEFTSADIMIGFSLTTMRYFMPYDLARCPNIVRYLARIAQRPAYRRAMEKGDPGFTPMLT